MIHDKIRELRLSRKWTVQELADKVSVGKSAISKYENGDAHPRKQVLEDLAKAFNVSISELLDEPRPDQSQLFKYSPKIFEKIMDDARLLNEEDKQLLATTAWKLLELKKNQDAMKAVKERLSV